jgi:hypothetical protein
MNKQKWKSDITLTLDQAIEHTTVRGECPGYGFLVSPMVPDDGTMKCVTWDSFSAWASWDVILGPETFYMLSKRLEAASGIRFDVLNDMGDTVVYKPRYTHEVEWVDKMASSE